MSTLTVEALENIAKLARQRIDAGIQYGDLSVPAKLFAGDDALGSARFRLSQIAQECNAHLFVSIENLIGADHA